MGTSEAEGARLPYFYPIHIDGRRRRRRDRTREVGGRLVAMRNRDNEQLEIEVSWSCVTHMDEDALSPALTIQVDARRHLP